MKSINYRPTLKLFALLIVFALGACQSPSGESEPEVPAISIHEAAFTGNAKAIQQHIEAGSDLNAKDEYGSTPLHIAVTFGKEDIAKLLIDAGADLSVRSSDGSTALHSAAFFCRTEIVKALLAAGADTEAKNNYGSTPLASVEPSFEQVRPIYDQISKDLGPLGLKLDYKKLEETRPVIAALIRKNQ